MHCYTASVLPFLTMKNKDGHTLGQLSLTPSHAYNMPINPSSSYATIVRLQLETRIFVIKDQLESANEAYNAATEAGTDLETVTAMEEKIYELESLLTNLEARLFALSVNVHAS